MYVATNPFTGIITSSFKQLHKYAIDALLEDTALTVRCLLNYEGTKFTVCPNCLPSNILGKSSNKYKPGGPLPFTQGICPYCQGVYKFETVSTEELYLVALWDAKSWIIKTPKTANIALQTMSKIETYGKLERVTKITVDTKVTNYGVADFVREGEPDLIGLGDSNYVIFSWKRA